MNYVKSQFIRYVSVLCCTAVISACSSIAKADVGGKDCLHDGDHPRLHNFDKFAKNLGLNDSQKTKAKVILQSNKDVIKPMIDNLRAEQKVLQTLLHADSFDEAAIRVETAKIAAIQADLHVNRAKTDSKLKAILTPAQINILKNIRQDRSHKKEEKSTQTEEK
jgi:Spy/CpxP family protein refolding chaperone